MSVAINSLRGEASTSDSVSPNNLIGVTEGNHGEEGVSLVRLSPVLLLDPGFVEAANVGEDQVGLQR